jgi:hypothetical protein
LRRLKSRMRARREREGRKGRRREDRERKTFLVSNKRIIGSAHARAAM